MCRLLCAARFALPALRCLAPPPCLLAPRSLLALSAPATCPTRPLSVPCTPRSNAGAELAAAAEGAADSLKGVATGASLGLQDLVFAADCCYLEALRQIQ